MRPEPTEAQILIERYQVVGDFIGNTRADMPEGAVSDALNDLRDALYDQLWEGSTGDRDLLAWRFNDLVHSIADSKLKPSAVERAALAMSDLVRMIGAAIPEIS